MESKAKSTITIKFVKMEYMCVDARFGFWDGKNKFTVEYSYGLATWFVFKNEEATGCLWFKKVNPNKIKSPNRAEADTILEEYLATLEVVQS